MSKDGGRFYVLEYLPNLPLNELFVHGRNSFRFWEHKFKSIKKFLEEARLDSVSLDERSRNEIENDTKTLYVDKTFDRISKFEREASFSISEKVAKLNENTITLEHVIRDCIDRTLRLPIVFSVLHGDLCLSNILYDSRTERIKVIDPRGLNFKNEFSIYGDQKYDVAKLAHSVIGLYDFIISRRYTIDEDEDGFSVLKFDIDERLQFVQSKFLTIKFLPNVSVLEIMPLVVLLFISMLPLHSDHPQRQQAMLLNSIRIYKKFVVNKS